MQLIFENNDSSNIIRGYDKGFVLINDVRYDASLIITPSSLLTDWGPKSVAEIKSGHIEKLIELNPEILILGTGDKHEFPAPEILTAIYKRRIGFEIMTTPAACRTYNVLSAEGRRVATALIINPSD